jgi:hypothetical protein
MSMRVSSIEPTIFNVIPKESLEPMVNSLSVALRTGLIATVLFVASDTLIYISRILNNFQNPSSVIRRPSFSDIRSDQSFIVKGQCANTPFERSLEGDFEKKNPFPNPEIETNLLSRVENEDPFVDTQVSKREDSVITSIQVATVALSSFLLIGGIYYLSGMPKSAFQLPPQQQLINVPTMPPTIMVILAQTMFEYRHDAMKVINRATGFFVIDRLLFDLRFFTEIPKNTLQPLSQELQAQLINVPTAPVTITTVLAQTILKYMNRHRGFFERLRQDKEITNS